MIHNNATPEIMVNAENYTVTIDGEKITCEPVDKLPLAQLYYLF